jgi:hypothetical protein
MRNSELIPKNRMLTNCIANQLKVAFAIRHGPTIRLTESTGLARTVSTSSRRESFILKQPVIYAKLHYTLSSVNDKRTKHVDQTYFWCFILVGVCLVIPSGVSWLWTFRTSVLFCDVLPLWFSNVRMSNRKRISKCTVGFRLFTSLARVWAEVRFCGIYDRTSGTEAGFLTVLRFHLPILISPNAPFLSSVIRGWCNRTFMASVQGNFPAT